MPVVAWTSHKGGTGRTVALTNAAMHLARPSPTGRPGSAVVCVDLDLASPTMGAVFGIKDMDMGSRVPGRGIHDLLKGGYDLKDARAMVVDVWAQSEIADFGDAAEALGMVPGRDKTGDLTPITSDGLAQLSEFIEYLTGPYEYVFLDIRSGLSGVAGQILHHERLRSQISDWVVMHRWTRQHISGACEMIERLALRLSDVNASPRLHRVVTAKLDPNEARPEMQQWLHGRDEQLRQQLRSGIATALMGLPDSEPYRLDTPLVEIPDEAMLRWQECVITPVHVRTGSATQDSLDAFVRLADNLANASGG